MSRNEERLLRIIEELVRKIPDPASGGSIPVWRPTMPPMCCADVGGIELYCHRPQGHVGAHGTQCGIQAMSDDLRVGPCLRPYEHDGAHDPNPQR